MPFRYMRLSQHSLLSYGLNDYSSVVLGALFLHAALLAGFVITCVSPDISLRSVSFAETLVALYDSDCGSLSAV